MTEQPPPFPCAIYGQTPPSWQQVLDTEGLGDWTVQESSAGGYCWLTDKRIDVPSFEDHGTFLHEVAHALREQVAWFPTGNDKHDGLWGDVFSRLVTTHTGMAYDKGATP